MQSYRGLWGFNSIKVRLKDISHVIRPDNTLFQFHKGAIKSNIADFVQS